jgi:hypothetical protein
MSDGKYAIVDSNNIVVNVIVWDGVTPYNPGPNMTLINIPEGVDCAGGWIYDPVTQTFTDPNPPAPPAE